MTEIKRVSDCIVNMDEDGIIEAIDNAIKNGISIDDIYEKV